MQSVSRRLVQRPHAGGASIYSSSSLRSVYGVLDHQNGTDNHRFSSSLATKGIGHLARKGTGGKSSVSQVSCLGASVSSPSRMQRAKAAAEEAVFHSLPEAGDYLCNINGEWWVDPAATIGFPGIRQVENHFVPILQKLKSRREWKIFHACIIIHGLSQSSFIVTKMVDQIGDMDYATRLFTQVENPNLFLYNSIIRASTHNSMYHDVIRFYSQMLTNSLVFPDRFTFPFMFKACASLGSSFLGKQVHGHLCKFGPMFSVVTDNALIDMYMKFDNLADAHQVFDEMSEKDVISWNSLLSGYARLGLMKKAKALFHSLPDKTIVSWTAMISGYTGIGCYVEAMEFFREMQLAGTEPDEISLISVLPSCAHLGSLELGKWIHLYADKRGFLKQTGVCNALIEMYSKCGMIHQAIQLFDHMKRKDVISWSTMISGYANHGNAPGAIETFNEMQRSKVKPNGITFLGLLSACSHVGLWEEGLEYFEMMKNDYRIEPKIEHYGCLIDVLARVGRLEHAVEIAKTMPMKPDTKIWGSLLSACRRRGNLDIALIAMDHLIELEPRDMGNYVMLSNIYADLGKWEDVSRMRKLIRNRNMKRTPGCSLIELNNVVHEFIAGDDRKPFWTEISLLLHMFFSHNLIRKDDYTLAFIDSSLFMWLMLLLQ